MKKLTTPWSMKQSAVERALASDIKKGLSNAQVERRIKEMGENKITQSKSITFWDILLEEIREPLILMLLVVGVLYSIWGDIGDTIMIICVIFTVTLTEVYTEYYCSSSIIFAVCHILLSALFEEILSSAAIYVVAINTNSIQHMTIKTIRATATFNELIYHNKRIHFPYCNVTAKTNTA